MKKKKKYMTYSDRFHDNFYEYQSYEAQTRLNLGWSGYDEGHCRHVNLLTYPEKYMNNKLLEAKRKALKAIEYLNMCVSGQIMDVLYLHAWNTLKDTEWPAWRK